MKPNSPIRTALVISALLLLCASLSVACTSSSPIAPIPTPDEHAILKTYLEKAKALVDEKKETSDTLFHKVGLGTKDVATMDGRKAWQEFAIRYYPVLLDFQSQWEALEPPPMAHGYHVQMTAVIENELERYMTIQMAPVALEDAFTEIVFGDLTKLDSELLLEAEAQRKFEALWDIATSD